MTFTDAMQRVGRYTPLLNEEVINREDNTRYKFKTITIIIASQRHDSTIPIYNLSTDAHLQTLIDKDCIIVFVLINEGQRFMYFEDNIEDLFYIKLNTLARGH